MSYKECTRCNRWFPEEEMFDLGFDDDELETVYSCEGCLISMEQDLFYGPNSVFQSNYFRETHCC
ncbi:MAG: hypothetical protein GY795_13890 [Desulfobacterales bacterium]|nr:hypothetical protein [Desulfobacterales bacterium]